MLFRCIVLPVHKGKDKTNVDNFRPVAQDPVAFLLFEKVMDLISKYYLFRMSLCIGSNMGLRKGNQLRLNF